jgi:uncharacterized membrane protein YidH (DUF202 family)
MSTPAEPADEPRDPGLQGERTSLAWNRTALTMFVNAVLILRAGLSSDTVPITAVGIVLLAGAGAGAACGAWRRRALLHHPLVTAPPPAVILGVALATLLACAAAVASVLVTA